jgi:hypothetical protein
MITSILDSTVGSGACEGEHPEGGECLEPLEQPAKVCHICGSVVVWVKNPESFKDKMKRKPTDDLGIEMLKMMGIHYFQTAAQLKQWQEFIKVIPESQIRETLAECGRSTRRYGWMKYTLNKLNWLVEHGKVEQVVVEEDFDPDAEFIP